MDVSVERDLPGIEQAYEEHLRRCGRHAGSG